MAHRTRITPSPGRRLGLQCEQAIRDGLSRSMAGQEAEQIRDGIDADACDGLTEEQFTEILGPIMQDALFPGLDDTATAEPTTPAPTPTPTPLVAELRALAGGRGDLLAETAGVMAAAWTVRIDAEDYLLAAGLLVLAGADHDLIARWVEVGRERMMTPKHSI
jgi:hypothetical protein